MKKILFTLVFLPFISVAQPDVVASGGSYFQTQNTQISYTVGQTVTATVGNNTAIMTQGFQQPEYVITQVSNDGNGIELNIYPNPTIGDVSVEFTQLPSGGVKVELVDNSGKVLLNDEINKTNYSLGMKNYPAGMYYFKVTNEKNTKVYKIIKK